MALLDFFLSRKKNTANIAKERLQIIVAERRRSDAEPHYLPQLRKDILEVICKYVQIDPEMVTVQLEQKDGDISILELNVTLPEAEEPAVKAHLSSRQSYLCLEFFIPLIHVVVKRRVFLLILLIAISTSPFTP